MPRSTSLEAHVPQRKYAHNPEEKDVADDDEDAVAPEGVIVPICVLHVLRHRGRRARTLWAGREWEG